MNGELGEDVYRVVRNEEEQYSIWPAAQDVPSGWSTMGDPAPRSDCLDYIEQVWTDLRPLSTRR